MPVSSFDSKVIVSWDTSDSSAVSSLFGEDKTKRSRMLSRMRTKIIDMSRSQNYISHVYKDSLRAMIHLMGEFSYINSENGMVRIKCMHANPERAVAKIKQLSNVVLPIITVSQTTTDNSPTRQRYSQNLLRETYWDDDKQKAIRVLSFMPKPIDILYQINVWTKYREDMDQILEQIRLMFNPAKEIVTPLSEVAKGFLDKEENISEVDVGDGSDRVIRKQLIVKLETYVPSPKYRITSTGEIISINTEIEIYKN